MKNIDIIVPVKNEEQNIKPMVLEIDAAFLHEQETYNIIFVVDESTDKTVSEIENLSGKYPIILHKKVGKPGKAFSILEGIDLCTSNHIAFIDGDLQYSPSHLPKMLLRLIDNPKTGVVIANRKTYKLTFIRKIISRLNAFIVGRLILGMKCDIQSGLKVFRKEIARHIDQNHITAWTFDIPLLSAASRLGYELDGVDIDFTERKYGATHVAIIKTSIAVFKCALKARFTGEWLFNLDEEEEFEKGIIYKTKAFTPHTSLHHSKSALYTLVGWQKILLSLFGIFTLYSFITSPLESAITVVGFLSLVYFADVLFNIYVILKSLHFPPELEFSKEEIDALNDDELPSYTVLCPLYKEKEVLPDFVENIENLNWPKDKMEVQLLLEENDPETVEAAREMNLPDYFKIMVVPHSMPKTKPKACNYGLLRATGEYVVIYDAEDKPERDQLKKAYLGFKTSGDKTICVQAKLNYYNTHNNLLTRLFTAEYSLWFDVILPGLQSIKTTIPLGGTSNHFITSKLRDLQGWDPFNVTEDCDLGVRLFKSGYKTAIIDSTTYEEANSDVKNWIRQRSRWIKGYMQTYFVHMRDPVSFVKQSGLHAVIFQLIIGLRIYFILINPFLWLATICYFVFYDYIGVSIEAIYPGVVFYMAVFSLIFGNFTYLFNYMIGCAKRGQWSVMKFVYLVPFYWALMFLAACMAFWQLIFNPHHWEKTKHGLHLLKTASPKSPGAQLFNPSISQLPWIGKLNSNGEITLIIASLVGSVLNYFYNAYLSRVLDIGDFGLISLFGNFLFIASLFFGTLSATVSYQSGYNFGKYGKIVASFWRKIRSDVFLISTIISILWILLIPFLQVFFGSQTALPFILFSPVWMIGALASVDYGYLEGSHKFKILSLMLVSEAVVKLSLTYLVVQYIGKEYLLAVFPLSMLVVVGLGYFKAVKLNGTTVDAHGLSIKNKFPSGFFTSSIIYKFSVIAFISIDLILARRYLSVDEAGYYALISLIGKMIYILSTMASQFLMPYISKSEGSNDNSKSHFFNIFMLTSLLGLGSFIVFGLLGNITAPILLGEKVMPVLYLLPKYSFAILLFTISSCIIGYHQIRKNYLFSVLSVLMVLLQVYVMGHFSNNLNQFVSAFLLLSFINFAFTAAMHIYEKRVLTIINNLRDLFGLFSHLPESLLSTEGPKVLFLNWRDTKHTWGGGAEVYVHEISKCLVKDGMSVLLFCGNDQKSHRYDLIDGVHIIRRGGQYTVYFWAFIYYMLKFKGKFDVIIDSENGIPFFSPLYARIPVIGLVYHIHRDIIIKELELAFYLKPLAHLARLLESYIMPLVYRNCQMITVSDSTKSDMKKIGLGIKNEIEIIHPGIEVGKFKVSKKTESPTLLYLGRIKAYKSIETAIFAVHKLINEFPDLILNIAGFGDHQPTLEKLVKKLSLEKNVKFLGKVSEEEKVRLMGSAWSLIYPSVWEGWGISVIEANACGTPVVASNVPGLSDSVNNPHSGYLVEYGNADHFAKKIKLIITDKKLRNNLEKSSKKWSTNFTWKKSSESLEILINTAAKTKDKND